MKTGLIPQKYDKRDYSFERTFGNARLDELPDYYNADAGFSVPDQNADGFPNGCTGYTISELCEDEDFARYDHAFTYQKSLQIDNLPPHSPLPIKTALKSSIVYGVMPEGGIDEQEAFKNRRGRYFDVDKVNGSYFEGIRSALWLNRMNRRTICAGTPWFWARNMRYDGVMRDFRYSGSWRNEVWHAWKICGWKTIDGEPYLICKPWQGEQWGHNGYGYLRKSLCDKLFNISGTSLHILVDASDHDIKNIQVNILEVILNFYYRILAKI